ncbi:hypothetical protein AV521_16170 [Streptomyces sp. IMTB 2501]|uniref:hypothetical protein n=1 Tax=Streptomyces sp. IMTB 2501 TaxID=1776340 RepID=UPI00096F717E|nr:hypothetical protein [Streptomyces sp. IMTB 2501]OLZ69875.1 hypothetical protein AV521_16170 [Streptomyces sp. IMTB 2501]
MRRTPEGGRAEGVLTGDGTTARSPIDAVGLTPTAKGTLVGTIYLVCACDPDSVVTVDVTITG